MNPVRQPNYPRSGAHSWRKIDLRCEDGRTAVGWLEDDFHHFGVTVEHHAGRVVAVHSAAPRYPWATCPAAGDKLQGLVGQALVRRATAIGEVLDMRVNCTHMYDLAGLVLAQAARGGAPRRYEACVTDRPVTQWVSRGMGVLGTGCGTLYRNGVEVLAWQVDGQLITGPGDLGGHSMDAGFRAWTEAMSEDDAECAHVLRRAILVVGGRNINYDTFDTADDTGVPALCHTFQPEQRTIAWHQHGSMVDCASGQGMLTEVHKVPGRA